MPETTAILRAFIAFELPEPVIHTAATLQHQLRDQGLKLRWVRPENIHLTLKFMATLPAERVATVNRAMVRAVQDQGPFSLSFQGLGVFPNMRRPRVLWAGLDGEVESLGEIHRRLEDSMATEGFAIERRPFKAHLTLARMPDRFEGHDLGRCIGAVSGFDPVPFVARELVLFQSRLDARGAIYTPLARVALSEVAQGRAKGV